MNSKEEQVTKELEQLTVVQEVNRKESRQLEELEEDCQWLAQLHGAFHFNISQIADEELAQYVAEIHEEVQALHRENFEALEAEKEQIQLEAKQLAQKEDDLLWERKRLTAQGIEEEERENGA